MPVIEASDQGERAHAIGAALAVLAVAIAVRLIGSLAYDVVAQ
jgi:hypothetical protein